MAGNESKEPAKTPDLDDPEHRWRVVRLLLIMSPGVFLLCYLLAWAQGAETRFSVLIAVVGTGMCLAAAGAIHLMGSKSIYALIALKIALALAAKR